MTAPLRVLLVDDEESILAGLNRALHSYRPEWSVHLAKSGEDALRFVERHPVDVVVVDLVMRGVDGHSVLRLLKTRCPGVVRIMLTAMMDAQSLVESAKVSERHVLKPCPVDKLVETIEELLRSRSKV